MIVRKTANVGRLMCRALSIHLPIKTPARQEPNSWSAMPPYLAVALIADCFLSSGDFFGCCCGIVCGFSVEMFYGTVACAYFHFAGYIKTGAALNEQFIGGDIAFHFCGFAHVEQFGDVQGAFKTAFNNGILAADFTFHNTRRADDYFRLAAEFSFDGTIYAQVIFATQ